MKIDIFDLPENLYYSDDHTWAQVKDGLIRIGIDDFLQKLLGAIVYVELPKVGKKIEQFKPWSVISSTNQKANRVFNGPPKDFKFDMETLELLAMRGGFCHCRLGERCPCPRAEICPCQKFVPVNYLIAPVSGVVKEVNQELADFPWNINYDPYGTGWIVAVEPTDLKMELNTLVTGEKISEWMLKEIEAKKDMIKVFKEVYEKLST